MWVTLLALFVAIVGLALTSLWFGVSRRRRAETELGIQVLARMKWRDCVALILEALQREGYRQTTDSLAAGDGGSEFLLMKDEQRVLLGYKHGTAYRLGEANVAEFLNALDMRGARSGILLTLGSAEAGAAEVARASNVQLIDGASLWPKVRPLMPPDMLEEIRAEAAGLSRKGLWAGVLGSLLTAGLVYALGDAGQAPAASPVVRSAAPGADARPLAPPANGTEPRADAAMLEQLNATAEAMAAAARLTAPELARRRADVAHNVGLMSQVDVAGWSAQRTLLVTLNRSDGKDQALVDEICRIVTQHEELRFTRIQLQPPAGSELSVRWRLCK
jgi:hypothetical protein